MSSGSPEARLEPVSPAERAHFDTPRGLAALWFGFLGGPLAWYLHLNISYALVRLICQTGDTMLLHLTTFATFLVALAALLMAVRSWRRLQGPESTRGAGTAGRSRFLALGGIALSGFFALILLVAWIPDFVIDPCVWQG